MKFPRIGRSQGYKVTVPDFCGGINYNRSVNLVADNQLTDGVNVWYKDGVLKTRPGLYTAPYMATQIWSTSGEEALNVGFNGKVTDVMMSAEGEYFRLYATHISDDICDRIAFEYFSEVEAVIKINDISGLEDFPRIENYFVFQHSKIIYAFLSFSNSSGDKRYQVYKNTMGSEEWNLEEDFYIPTMMLNGSADMQKIEYNGDLYEGPNLLSGKYKAYFNAFSLEENKYFVLPTGVKSGTEVVINHTDSSGEVYQHTLVASAGEEILESTPKGDKLKVKFYAGSETQNAYFVICSNQGEENNGIKSDEGLKNNIEVFVETAEDVGSEKIFDMKFCTWFGGTSSGREGGTRLFLAGNDEEGNCIRWCDFDNPLYFPQKCYAKVGDPSQSITAFGKQSDMLIIFKERQIYYTKYNYKSISEDDIDNGSVTDVTVSEAVFPIIPINGSIGCDCPNTIQLCKNRLIWATSAGEIYTLSAVDQYSNMNVYECGRMIERRLKRIKKVDLRNAFSAEADGHYFLCVGNKIFVLNCGSYGYSRLGYYTDHEETQERMVWWYWELPFKSDAFFSNGTSLNVISYKTFIHEGKNSGMVAYAGWYILDESKNLDSELKLTYSNIGDSLNENIILESEGNEISCRIQSKIFDFDNPQILKNISQAYIGVGSGGDGHIRVSFITETNESKLGLLSFDMDNDYATFTYQKSNYSNNEITLENDGNYDGFRISLLNDDSENFEELIYIDCKETDVYAPGFISEVKLLPQEKNVRRFGIKIESDTFIALSNMIINYKTLGSVK